MPVKDAASTRNNGCMVLIETIIIAMMATVGALIFTAITFLRLRKTEQVRLVDGFLMHLRELCNEYNMSATKIPVDDHGNNDPSYMEKLHRMLDHILGALNWISFLILSDEIKDPKLEDYFKGKIIEDYNKFYIPHKSEFPPNAFLYFRQLYEKYKKENEKRKP